MCGATTAPILNSRPATVDNGTKGAKRVNQRASERRDYARYETRLTSRRGTRARTPFAVIVCLRPPDHLVARLAWHHYLAASRSTQRTQLICWWVWTCFGSASSCRNSLRSKPLARLLQFYILHSPLREK